MAAPDPNAYRHLEDAAAEFLRDRGWRTFRTGQEYSPQLERWSPDFWVSAGFWADAKIRNRSYTYFLIEWAEIQRHIEDFPPTVYLLVGDNPLEICGWITAEEAARRRLQQIRTDHRGNGSSDPYVQINAVWLHEPSELTLAVLTPLQLQLVT